MHSQEGVGSTASTAAAVVAAVPAAVHAAVHAVQQRMQPGRQQRTQQCVQSGRTSKAMMLGRPEYARATLIAFSTASEPLLQKKNRLRLDGTMGSILPTSSTCSPTTPFGCATLPRLPACFSLVPSTRHSRMCTLQAI